MVQSVNSTRIIRLSRSLFFVFQDINSGHVEAHESTNIQEVSTVIFRESQN